MTKKIKSQVSKNNNQGKGIVQQQFQHYSGIIPHPSVIEGYERNCSGATDRILAMTENELKNKQELEKMEQENINICRVKALENELETNKRGQIFGFILLFMMIIGGFFLIYSGRSIGGYATIITTLILSISSILHNKKNNKN